MIMYGVDLHLCSSWPEGKAEYIVAWSLIVSAVWFVPLFVLIMFFPTLPAPVICGELPCDGVSQCTVASADLLLSAPLCATHVPLGSFVKESFQ